MKKYLGIDVGGTKIKYGVYDLYGNEQESGITDTKKDTIDEFVDVLVNISNKYRDVEGLGLSIPSIVNSETGQIINPGNIKVLSNVNLKRILEERINIKVEIQNDANCVGLAEKWIGNGQDHKNFVCLTLGTGIGGAIIIEDNLYTGAHNFAGEFGYIIIQEPLQNPRAADIGEIASTSGLVKMVADKKEWEVAKVDGYRIFKIIDEGDKEVEEIYDKWLTYLAVGIGNICYSLDPEKVLIGGGVSSVDRLINDLRKKLNNILPKECRIWDIDVCKHFNNSGKIGAIYNFIQKNK